MNIVIKVIIYTLYNIYKTTSYKNIFMIIFGQIMFSQVLFQAPAFTVTFKNIYQKNFMKKNDKLE